MEELRRFIQRRPEDLEASEARARIVAIEYQKAREANTRYAFASFIERHPDSSEAIRARRELEKLDFDAAARAGAADGYLAFLRTYPRSALAEQAQAAVEQLLCEQALARAERAALERLIAERPDIACRAKLDEARKRARHAEALASRSLRPLLEFVADYPEDPLTRELQARLREAELEQWIQAGRFDLARERVIAQADAAQAPALEARLADARRAWEWAGFDAPGRSARESALAKRLAASTRLVRGATPAAPPRLARVQDPRARWLAAQALAARPDEAAADELLEALGDAYLGVREAAWESLGALVVQLTPERAEIWLASRRLALARTARSGLLLLRLAALAELSGDVAEAERLLQRLLAEQDPPDLFTLHRLHALVAARGDTAEAASLARRFSDEAGEFARRRREAWSESGPGLRGSQEGYLVLRQLHGLAALWARVLAPYRREPPQLDPHPATLGPWPARSGEGLAELRAWLADEEDRWARAHPGYQAGDAPAPLAADGQTEQALFRALTDLAFSGGERAAPTVEQAACCAALPKLRLLAAAARAAVRLSRLAAFPAGLP